MENNKRYTDKELVLQCINEMAKFGLEISELNKTRPLTQKEFDDFLYATAKFMHLTLQEINDLHNEIGRLNKALGEKAGMN